MTGLLTCIQGYERFQVTEGDENIYARVFDIMSQLEAAWHEDIMDGTITLQPSPAPAFPALPGKSKTPAKTPAEIEAFWKRFHLRRKNASEAQGRPFPQSVDELKAATKCYYCGQNGCIGPVCPRKLNGTPPVAGARPHMQGKHPRRHGRFASQDTAREARAFLAAEASERVFTALANGDDISYDDCPELHESLACLAEEVDESPPTDDTPGANDTSEAFAGVAATVGLHSRGQRDPAFHEAFNDVAGLYGNIDDGDDDSQDTFGDFP